MCLQWRSSGITFEYQMESLVSDKGRKKEELTLQTKYTNLINIILIGSLYFIQWLL